MSFQNYVQQIGYLFVGIINDVVFFFIFIQIKELTKIMNLIFSKIGG